MFSSPIVYAWIAWLLVIGVIGQVIRSRVTTHLLEADNVQQSHRVHMVGVGSL